MLHTYGKACWKKLSLPDFIFMTIVWLFLSSARIQQLKHAVPKGDNKKKKEVVAQVAILEAELTARHEEELEALKKPATVCFDAFTVIFVFFLSL